MLTDKEAWDPLESWPPYNIRVQEARGRLHRKDCLEEVVQLLVQYLRGKSMVENRYDLLRYNYAVTYDPEEKMYVASCAELPMLGGWHPDPSQALQTLLGAIDTVHKAHIKQGKVMPVAQVIEPPYLEK